MVQTRFKGKITNLILNSGDLAVSGNVTGVRWRENNDRIQAEKVANVTTPVGWYQGIREAEVEIRIKGEATEILGSDVALISATGDNLVLTSCAVTFVNHLGSSMIIFINNPIVTGIASELAAGESTETTIQMKAYYVTLPKLA